jgi:hypothetical protein
MIANNMKYLYKIFLQVVFELVSFISFYPAFPLAINKKKNVWMLDALREM